MCGRAYSTYSEEELVMRYLNRKPIGLPSFKPNYNLAPTQLAPVIRIGADGARQLDLFNWGLIPSWAPEFKTKLSTINAKSETAFDSKLYRGAVLKRRCIVPLSGFIEWKSQAGKSPKRPFKISLKKEPIMSMAGIWEAWHPGTPEERHSFSILTTEANSLMKDLHHRMPVILPRESESAWLDPEIQEPEMIARLLLPYSPDSMETLEIGTVINSPRNNRPEVLEPLN